MRTAVNISDALAVDLFIKSIIGKSPGKEKSDFFEYSYSVIDFFSSEMRSWFSDTKDESISTTSSTIHQGLSPRSIAKLVHTPRFFA